MANQPISGLLRHKLIYRIPFSKILLMVSSDILDNLLKVREKRKSKYFCALVFPPFGEFSSVAFGFPG